MRFWSGVIGTNGMATLALFQHPQILPQQDAVGTLPRDIDRGVDRDADIGRPQGRRVVDAIAKEADDVTPATEQPHHPLLLCGREPGQERG